jgi:hypothetical protein
MKWRVLKTDLHFLHVVKIGTVIGILVTVSGIIREMWHLFQVNEARSRAASDAVLESLNMRMISWVALGMLVTFIFIGVAIIFKCFRDNNS